MSDSTETERPEAGITPRPSRRMVLAISLVIVVVLGIVSSLGFTAGASVACSYCHPEQSSAHAGSGHSVVPCRTCHFSLNGPVASRLDVLLRMAPRALGGVQLEGPGRPIDRGVCLNCHDTIQASAVVGGNGIRINHASCTLTSQCESCHTASVHSEALRFVKTPKMADCVACHREEGASLECDTCHEQKRISGRSRDAEWTRTHGADWKKLHGTGDLRTCSPCHTPDSCAKCHGIDLPHPTSFGSTHGRSAKKVGAKTCLTCHETAEYCNACHGIEMPHPDGFLQKHSSLARSDSDPRCVTCHVTEDCETCHTYHVHPGGTQPPVGRLGDGK